jgi:hypothetical protein
MDVTRIIGSQGSINANVFEFYLYPGATDGSDGVVSVMWKKIIHPMKFGTSTTQYVKEYHYRDMVYIYDLDSDNQRVVRRLAQESLVSPRASLCALSYLEEVLPSHRFPSTLDMTHIDTFKRTTYRINNRVQFIHDADETKQIHYYYFRYMHSENVDMHKIDADIQRAFTYVRQLLR